MHKWIITIKLVNYNLHFNLKTNNFTQIQKATYMYAAEINIQYSILVKFQFGINFDLQKQIRETFHVCIWKTLVEYINYLIIYL